MKADLFRLLPSVEQLLQEPVGVSLVESFGRPLCLEAVRSALDAARQAIRAGRDMPFTNSELYSEAQAQLATRTAATMRPVINATGVIIHTNLGRAPLSEAALMALSTVGQGYSTLEYELGPGKRGSRSVHARDLLAQITGAEAATVVNNNAAAVLLTLTALASGCEVVISRGQLVEIGGGFRIPEVMGQSGARLVEVGTTNRTHLWDYQQAITPNTRAIMVAHHSNFAMVGFTAEPDLAELAALARDHGLLLLHDLGSGSLLDTAAFGLRHEPTVQESLAAGVDLACFSGDKLLGGPQAGLIVGRADAVEKVARHPLARAVRPDKLCLAALSATLLHYLKDEAVREIPIWRMIAKPAADLKRVAHRWARHLTRNGLAATVTDGHSAVGGGSLPGTVLPTWLVVITHPHPAGLSAGMRAAPVPVIGRIDNDCLVLDPRTVMPGEERALLCAVLQAADRS